MNAVVRQQKTLAQYLDGDIVKSRLAELLGDKEAKAVASSLVQIVNSSSSLAKCSHKSVLSAAVSAALLKLPIDKALGHAYIVEYKGEATLQIGYLGYIQLALRTGLFQTIDVVPVYAGDTSEQVKERMNSFLPVDDVDDREPVAYTAMFVLKDGFFKVLSMSVPRIREHADKFSASKKFGKKGQSLWDTSFEAMAMKTVLKMLLRKYAPMPLDALRAINSDDSDNYQSNPVVEDIVGSAAGSVVDNVFDAKIVLNDELFEALVENIRGGHISYEVALSDYDLSERQREVLNKEFGNGQIEIEDV